MDLNKNIIFDFLNKIKWFGLRKTYYIGKTILDKRELNKNLVNKKLAKFIIENYNGFFGQNASLKDGTLGLGLLHYSLIANNKPKHILVVGSMKGYIPAIMACACKEIESGIIDFVDAGFDDEKENNWGGIGFWKKINIKEHFSKIGVENYIKTYIMKTEEFAKKYPSKKYQYIYIDGDHSYEGVQLDYKLFFPKLEKNGLMLFHNTIAAGSKKRNDLGVKMFWKELNNQKINIIYPKDSGLGIIQKT